MSPFLNSEGLRVSAGCGAVASEHLVAEWLTRGSVGLGQA